MHESAYRIGKLAIETYLPDGGSILDFGSGDNNGTLRDHCPPDKYRYTGVDCSPGKGVDLVVNPGEKLPFDHCSFDMVVASSSFEHDQFFWESFVELLRVVNIGGYVYINAPSNGAYHRHPVDCWRFYPDAGVALVAWATRCGIKATLIESFISPQGVGEWNDFVMVAHRGYVMPTSKSFVVDRVANVINVRRFPKTDIISDMERETEDQTRRRRHPEVR